jgi:hypothetical protein
MIDASRAKVVAEDEAGQKQIALDEKDKALDALLVSERAKSEQLFEALVAQARANRLSRRPGQRFESLAIIERATAMARELNLPPERFLELRNAAIAALALPDLYPVGPTVPIPPDCAGYSFDAAHRLAAVLDRHGGCAILHVADGSTIHRLAAPSTRNCQMSPDGRFVAITCDAGQGGRKHSIEIWRLDEAQPRQVLAEPGEHVTFDRESKRAALGYLDGAIAVFDLSNGRRLHQLAPDVITGDARPALHPTEPLVAVCSYGSAVVQIRELKSGKAVSSIPQGAGVLGVAWHPDGQMLAVAPEAMLVRLYDRATNRRVGPPHSRPPCRPQTRHGVPDLRRGRRRSPCTSRERP